MDDRTSDLTDEQLYATMGEHWPNPGRIISEQEYWRRYAASLRAVAALARQGWAPVGTGPSIEDLGPLIVRLGDMAIEAANAGQSDDAGMLTWASLVLGERVNEDAPDHVANASNMVAPPACVPSDIQQALVDAESALADIADGRAHKVLAPLEWAEERAFRALGQIRPVMRRFSVRTSERPAVPTLPAGEGS